MSKISFSKGIANLIFIICYSFFLSIICTSCSAQNTSQKLVEFDVQEVTYRNQKFDVVKIDLRKTPIQFFWKNKNGKLIRSLENLKNELKNDNRELLFAMNAGMYQRDRDPKGLYIENGKTIKSLDTLQDGYGNFYLQPNGVFYLKADSAGVLPSNLFSQKNISSTWATQSGPMLLTNEKVHPIFREGSTNLNIRNGVGVMSKHEIVFAISHKEINFFDFAMLFKEELNCKNALYLDGFVSRAYIPTLNRKDLDGNFGVMIGVFK